MSTPRFVSLIGLGFGDCGKGMFTDALCRHWQAHTVVRFNGGAQAGHNVVLPDGRHHTFSQFAAGMLIPGVVGVLAYPVVVHPGALLVEEAHLRSIGVCDGFQRLLVDGRCRVNTPFHQAAGRIRELLRGSAAHGTCGVGVGETVRHALTHPDHVLRYSDLARPALAMQKLELIRQDLLAEFADGGVGIPQSAEFLTEFRMLTDPLASERWLTAIDPLLRQVRPASADRIGERLLESGTVLFEGAQGVLLDEWKGFHPHTTWSSIHPRAVDAVAGAYGFNGKVEHLGILRAYLTRHGAGPFPTADSALDILPEPHNSDRGWQGQFRRGHPDSVLLRYALAAAGKLDGLLISHLDVFEKMPGLRWCEAYAADAAGPITRLPFSDAENLEHQCALTRVLSGVSPVYAPQALRSAESLVEAIEHTAGCSVWFGAYGPTYRMLKAIETRWPLHRPLPCPEGG